jgi:hypothetical protein
MMQTFIQKLRIMRSAPVLLGRWCRTDKKLNDVKVDLANVDHCGICVHENLPKNEKIPSIKIEPQQPL